MFDFLDTYTVRARAFPALLAILPPIVAAVAAVPALATSWAVIGSVVLSFGGIFLLAQLGRDRGKRLEVALFKRWGGKPTTRALSYCSQTDRAPIDRLHEQLGRLWPDIRLPTPSEECDDPETAARRYEEVTSRVKGATRDSVAFPLVFAENCNYGFRRNLWGLKQVGLPLTLLSMGTTAAFLFVKDLRPAAADTILLWIALLLSGVFTWLWTAIVSPDWVRVPAKEYSTRLFEAVPELLKRR